MKHRLLLALALPCSLSLVACGGDDEQTPIDAPVAVDAPAIDAPTVDGPTIDAPTDGPAPIDAPIDAASSVQVIPDCTGITDFAVTVNAGSGMYVPQNPTLAVNEVLRFIPGVSNHDMAAVNGEFATPLGQTACLRFTAAGTFPVRCTIHQFTGTITVTAN